MKKLLFTASIVFTALSFFSCNNNAKQESVENNDTIAVEVKDSAVYGKIGEGTMMHTLEVITDEGETFTFDIDEYGNSEMMGGMMVGDRVTATYMRGEDGNILQKGINLTTILGRWTSLDRNFTINEDGTIESNVQAESRPYTHWTMVNSQLVLNVDTFDIITLNADSMSIENANGIFVYKRQK